ncbi:MAG: M56 family metallopeptidase [Opitutales bacterium]|jgi:beta-lactamase regulating signal transducer with metallopeptidase domain|nr:M56 family metallopeptidase [Opitutales bacterium]MDP4644437.1 M56 family metallopeptidase [Opitutales bacterium]MDP4777309.1 M56 family metallopeptidase [Opitutales bacterium]MDP4883532.1 M56 family metallopeptidase [Opitutales bacterium]
MNVIYELFSSDFARGLLVISLRYSIVLLVALLILGLTKRLSNSLSALVALIALASIAIIAGSQYFVPTIELKVLPWESPTAVENITHAEVVGLSATSEFSSDSAVATSKVSSKPIDIDILFVVWLMGALALLTYWIFGQIRLARILRSAVLVGSDCKMGVYLTELTAEQSLHRPIELYLSDVIKVPFACRSLKPAIVLPSDATNWSLSELRMVLLHELAHIKRRDVPAQTLINLTLSVQWFNPLVWIIYRLYVTDREKACDDHVLRTGSLPTEYGECLINFVKRNHMPKYLAQVGLNMAATRTIESRLQAILDSKRRHRLPSRLSQCLAILPIVLFALPVSLVRLDAKSVKEAMIPVDVAKSESQIQVSATFIELKSELAMTSGFQGMVGNGQTYTVITQTESDEIVKLAQTSGSNRLKAPTMVMQSGNGSSVIIVGRELRNPKYILDEKQVKVDGFKVDQMGVTLKAEASILADGSLSLDLETRVSEFMGFVEFREEILKSGYTLDKSSWTDHLIEESDGNKPRVMIPVLKVEGRNDLADLRLQSGAVVGFWLKNLEEWNLEKRAAPILEAFDGVDTALLTATADESELSQVLVLVTAKVLPSEGSD